MKITRFAVDNKARYGIINDESIQVIEDKPFRQLKVCDHYYRLSEVKLLPPCLPSKIVALSLNYHSHAKELNATLPNAPLTFLKPSTAVIGPEDNIIYPSASARVDYEGRARGSD
jgi:2-keto-4-pentenoate hydratase/2-oxohepta-3-ene-1,7-dioic acid hydratase in catechol pathway